MAPGLLPECRTWASVKASSHAALPDNLIEKFIGDIVLGVLVSRRVLGSQGRDLNVGL